MPHDWSDTRRAWRRFNAAWDNASEDVRHTLRWRAFGRLLMCTMIVVQFGWAGAFFVLGWVLSATPFKDK